MDSIEKDVLPPPIVPITAAVPTLPKKERTGPRKRYVCHTETPVKPRSRYDPAYYIAFRGFDKDKGIEITWHQFKVDSLKPSEITDLLMEIDIFKRLDHPCILTIKDGWFDDKLNLVVIITGTCIQAFLDRVSGKLLTPEKVMRRWAYQLSSGLKYLHDHEPTVHTNGNLVCANIFMNGNKGDIKVGVFGMIKGFKPFQTYKNNYISPELCGRASTAQIQGSVLIDEPDSVSDVYVLGTVILELVTREITFLELQEDKAKIQKHLLSDIHPLSFSRVPEGYIRNFILKCWQPRELRPSPAELLCDPWFAAIEESDIFTRRKDASHGKLKKSSSEPISYVVPSGDVAKSAIPPGSHQSLSNSNADMTSMFTLLMSNAVSSDNLMPNSSTSAVCAQYLPTPLVHESDRDRAKSGRSPVRYSSESILPSSDRSEAFSISQVAQSLPEITINSNDYQDKPGESILTKPMLGVTSPVNATSIQTLKEDGMGSDSRSYPRAHSVVLSCSIRPTDQTVVNMQITLCIEDNLYDFAFHYNLETDNAMDVAHEFASQELSDFFDFPTPDLMFSELEIKKLAHQLDSAVQEFRTSQTIIEQCSKDEHENPSLSFAA